MPLAAFINAELPHQPPLPRVRAVWGDQPEASAAKPLPRIRFSDRPAPSQGSSYDGPDQFQRSKPAAESAALSTPLLRAGIRPADCHRYIDTIKCLGKRPIPEADIEMLRSHCKHLDIRPHGAMVFPRSGAPYQINIHPWRFRIEIHLPDPIALEYLARCPGLKLTRVDLAQDWTFDDEQPKLDLFETFAEHLVQPHLKRYARISFDNEGLSTGRRRKGRYFTLYASRACRIDGIVDCLHIECRHLGTQALAQIGLYSPADLLDFDHAAYWHRIEANQLLAIDKEHLGRFHSNRRSNMRRRATDPKPFYGRRSEDHWLGSLLYRIHAMDDRGQVSVQSFLHNYGRGPFVINLGIGNKNAFGRVDTGRKHDAMQTRWET
jgi:hypothetical protein